jgi:hypothetical protein
VNVAVAVLDALSVPVTVCAPAAAAVIVIAHALKPPLELAVHEPVTVPVEIVNVTDPGV